MYRFLLDSAFVAEVLEVHFLFHVAFVIFARYKFLLEDDVAVLVFLFHGADIQVIGGLDADGANFSVVALFD